MKDEEDEKIEESTDMSEGMEKYLLEKFGGKRPDSEIDSYLDDKFRQYDLPNGQKRKLTVAEMIRDAETRRRFI